MTFFLLASIDFDWTFIYFYMQLIQFQKRLTLVNWKILSWDIGLLVWLGGENFASCCSLGQVSAPGRVLAPDRLWAIGKLLIPLTYGHLLAPEQLSAHGKLLAHSQISAQCQLLAPGQMLALDHMLAPGQLLAPNQLLAPGQLLAFGQRIGQGYLLALNQLIAHIKQ